MRTHHLHPDHGAFSCEASTLVSLHCRCLMSKGVLNYDKWSSLVDSDDEHDTGKVKPLLESTKGGAQRDADASVAERFSTYLRRHLRNEYPISKRQMAARFIGAQHRGSAYSNIFRYNDICSFAARVRQSLLVCSRQASACFR